MNFQAILIYPNREKVNSRLQTGSFQRSANTIWKKLVERLYRANIIFSSFPLFFYPASFEKINTENYLLDCDRAFASSLMHREIIKFMFFQNYSRYARGLTVNRSLLNRASRVSERERERDLISFNRRLKSFMFTWSKITMHFVLGLTISTECCTLAWLIKNR